ncbi:MAG: hypothetical protein AVDCRST_MAG01-01-1356, partial [uncultured Rubrobacteraceae bacterium]
GRPQARPAGHDRRRLPRADHPHHRCQLRHRCRVRARVRRAGLGRRARRPAPGATRRAGRRTQRDLRHTGDGDPARPEPSRFGSGARGGGGPARPSGDEPRQQRGFWDLRPVPRRRPEASPGGDQRRRRQRRRYQPGVYRAAAGRRQRGDDQRREHGGVRAHPQHGRVRGGEGVRAQFHRGAVAGVPRHGAARDRAVSRSNPHRVQRRSRHG